MNTFKTADGIFLIFTIKKIHATRVVENQSNFKKLNQQEIKNKILNSMNLFDRLLNASPDSANKTPKNLR